MLFSLAVFMFSGCGGSSDTTTDESTDTPETAETQAQNDGPNTYSIQSILDGTWAAVDQEVSITAGYGDDELGMYLITANLTFSGTSMDSKTRGEASVTGHESWYTFLQSDLSYMGVQNLDVDNEYMTISKTTADQWRCEIGNPEYIVLSISVLSETMIEVSEHRVAELDNVAYGYDVTFTMRKLPHESDDVLPQ